MHVLIALGDFAFQRGVPASQGPKAFDPAPAGSGPQRRQPLPPRRLVYLSESSVPTFGAHDGFLRNAGKARAPAVIQHPPRLRPPRPRLPVPQTPSRITRLRSARGKRGHSTFLVPSLFRPSPPKPILPPRPPNATKKVECPLFPPVGVPEAQWLMAKRVTPGYRAGRRFRRPPARTRGLSLRVWGRLSNR